MPRFRCIKGRLVSESRLKDLDTGSYLFVSNKMGLKPCVRVGWWLLKKEETPAPWQITNFFYP